MKFQTNFFKPVGRLMPYLTAGLFALSAVAVVISIYFIVVARQISEGMQVTKVQLLHYQKSEVLVPVNLLPREKLVELRDKIHGINELTNFQGPPLSLLMYRLEQLIPDGAWLVALQYRAPENESKLVVEARKTELLTVFMDKLERSGYFSQVLLTRQTQNSERTQSAVQFEIQLKGGV